MKSVSYVKITIVVLLGIWAAVLGTMLGHIYNLIHLPQRIPVEQTPQPVHHDAAAPAEQKKKEYWTVALFGVDSRDGSLGKGNMSDMEMVCSIHLETGEIRLVSVYRDTYLKIDPEGHYSKINQAYCDGGPAQAVEALDENLDLEIDDYVAFNWKAVVDAVNILGGIDLEISQAEFKVINGFITETVQSTGVGSHQLKHAGMNHLDGVQAVAYARLRKMDTDFQRTGRQREVAELLMAKAKKADFSVLNNILVTVLPQTATSIGIRDLIPIAKNLRRFHLGDTDGFPFTLKDMLLNKKDCVVPDTLQENVVSLHKKLYEEEDYQPSARVRQISREIEKRSSF